MSEENNVLGNWWAANSSRTKTVAIAAGGALALGLGGYLIYRSLSNKGPTPCEDLNTTEVSPPTKSSENQSLSSPGQPSSSLSSVDYSKKRAELLARAINTKEKGNKLFNEKKYVEAVKCYDEAIEICPAENKLELATFHQNRAAAYEKLNDLEKAYDDFTAALKLNQRYQKALFRRADLCERMQRLHEAMQDFMKCCIIENFSNIETSKRADNALRVLAQKLAKEYMEIRGDKFRPLSDIAIKDLLHSYACDPVVSPHLNIPGVSSSYRSGGDSASKQQQMAKGDARDEPNDQLTGYRKAVNCLINKQYDRIIDACTEEIDNFEQSINYVECLLLRATFYYFKGQFKKSESDLEKVFDILKDKSDESSKQFLSSAHIKMTLLEHQKGNVEKCLQFLSKAEKIMPENPDVYSLRGQIYSYTRDYKKASVDFARCVTLRPNFAHFAVQQLGAELKTASESSDDFAVPKVVRDFEELVKKFPDSAEVNLIYAQILCDAGEYEVAIKYFGRAQKLEPQSPSILCQRGLLELYFKNPDGMKKMLEQALKIDPYCMMALEIEAQYHSRRNDVPKMLESYNKALEMARSEAEVAHFISMREITLCQIKVAEEMLIGGSGD